jgi:hypothetical protein
MYSVNVYSFGFICKVFSLMLILYGTSGSAMRLRKRWCHLFLSGCVFAESLLSGITGLFPIEPRLRKCEKKACTCTEVWFTSHHSQSSPSSTQPSPLQKESKKNVDAYERGGSNSRPSALCIWDNVKQTS